jgi:hypothetical protein
MVYIYMFIESLNPKPMGKHSESDGPAPDTHDREHNLWDDCMLRLLYTRMLRWMFIDSQWEGEWRIAMASQATVPDDVLDFFTFALESLVEKHGAESFMSEEELQVWSKFEGSWNQNGWSRERAWKAPCLFLEHWTGITPPWEKGCKEVLMHIRDAMRRTE